MLRLLALGWYYYSHSERSAGSSGSSTGGAAIGKTWAVDRGVVHTCMRNNALPSRLKSLLLPQQHLLRLFRSDTQQQHLPDPVDSSCSSSCSTGLNSLYTWCQHTTLSNSSSISSCNKSRKDGAPGNTGKYSTSTGTAYGDSTTTTSSTTHSTGSTISEMLRIHRPALLHDIIVMSSNNNNMSSSNDSNSDVHANK